MSAIIKQPTIVLNNVLLGPSSGGAGTGGVIDLTPWTDFSWADEITWQIVALGVNGSPTAGNLTAKFQLGAPYLFGFQFSTNKLFDPDISQVLNMTDEGEDWPSPICSFNSDFTNRVIVQRTVRNPGPRCNLHLDASTLTGGTTPTFTLTVLFIAKGR